MDKDYNILNVERRDRWHSAKFNKDYQTYALQLEGVDGWVELSQLPETPAPEVGGTIFGHTYPHQVGQNTYLKFKKTNRDYQGPATPQATTPNQLVGTEKTLEYIVEMLEELTGRRTKKVDDVVLEDIDDTPIDLSDIPF